MGGKLTKKKFKKTTTVPRSKKEEKKVLIAENWLNQFARRLANLIYDLKLKFNKLRKDKISV